jgi:hypothetical protein
MGIQHSGPLRVCPGRECRNHAKATVVFASCRRVNGVTLPWGSKTLTASERGFRFSPPGSVSAFTRPARCTRMVKRLGRRTRLRWVRSWDHTVDPAVWEASFSKKRSKNPKSTATASTEAFGSRSGWPPSRKLT